MLNDEQTDGLLDFQGEESLYLNSFNMWHPVAYSDEIGPDPVAVRLLDQQLVLVKLNGVVNAFKDLCIHRGTALSLGKVINNELQCAYHGWRFDGSGACTLIPSRPIGSIPNKAKIEKYLTADSAGLIWVCLTNTPKFPVPEFKEFSDSEYRTVKIPLYDWHSSAARRMENFVDFSHFPFVHEGILGLPDKTEIPDHEVHRNDTEIWFDLGVEEPTNNLKGDAETGDVVQRKPSRYTIYMPYSVRLDQPLEGENHFLLFMASAPLSRKEVRSFCFGSRNYDMDPSEDQKQIDFQNLILEQDRVVVESQRPEELPIDLASELHVKGVDRVSIEYRRWLIELAK
jgi:vanillate O-demethylase monooxygenase subunit